MNGTLIVDDYLRQLEAAARRLPSDRARDLVAEIRGHIDLALAETDRADEAAVRSVLDRRGTPEGIVAAEAGLDAGGPPNRPADAATVTLPLGWGVVEIVAVVLLTVGYFALPIVGPLLGLVLAWASRRWSVRLKLVVTVIVVALLAAPVLALLWMRVG